jgi:uncharacterized protein YcfL
MGLTRCNVNQVMVNQSLVMDVHVDDCTIEARTPELVKQKLRTVGRTVLRSHVTG